MWKLLTVLAVIAAASATPTIRRGRITGGTETRIEDHPFNVAVFYFYRFNCGGSIYNPTTIISAAHCTFGRNPNLFGALVGQTDHEEGYYNQVSEVIEHPNYNDNTYENDIVILRLYDPIVYSDRIQPVNLPPPNFNVPANQQATLTGWGSLAFGDEEPPTILRVVSVPTTTNAACQATHTGRQIFESNLCAGESGRGACTGDDGGPLIYSGFQVGIFSWGNGCGTAFPGVYTRVSDFLSFIITNSN